MASILENILSKDEEERNRELMNKFYYHLPKLEERLAKLLF